MQNCFIKTLQKQKGKPKHFKYFCNTALKTLPLFHKLSKTKKQNKLWLPSAIWCRNLKWHSIILSLTSSAGGSSAIQCTRFVRSRSLYRAGWSVDGALKYNLYSVLMFLPESIQFVKAWTYKKHQAISKWRQNE